MPKNNRILHVYCDGGARNNPGPAAIGVAVFDDKNRLISEVSEYIGAATNNIAEYIAMIFGAQEAAILNCSEVCFYLDSQLVARQISGEYKVKDKNLKKFHLIAVHMLKTFNSFKIVEVPRKKNAHADALVNRALDNNSLI